jgi:hypothetical protein
LAPAQTVLQAEPASDPETVTLSLGVSLTLIAAPVDGLVRMFTLAQAGIICVAGEGVGPLVGAALAVGGAGWTEAAGPDEEVVGVSTPVAANRTETPNRVETGWPSTWVIVYHVEPDFQPGQLVPHDDPLTVPETVRL